MTVNKVDHIGIAVRDIDAALGVYADALGLEAFHSEVVEEQGVRAVFLRAGETHLELLQPLDDASPIAGFLAKRGEGLHHICLDVSDIEGTLRHLEEHGLRLIDQQPRRGAHNKMIAFVHPKAPGGVLLELSEVDGGAS